MEDGIERTTGSNSVALTREALCRLSSDAVMAGLIERYGATGVYPREPFGALTRAIISQQISTRAANTIRERLRERIGATAGTILLASIDSLVSVGITARKAQSLKEAALLAQNGILKRIQNMSDNDVLDELTAINGIGPWTAQMFLIFGLARDDIWPVGDGGLQRAAERSYRATNRNKLVELGHRFGGVRSHAAWYLWRSLENS